MREVFGVCNRENECVMITAPIFKFFLFSLVGSQSPPSSFYLSYNFFLSFSISWKRRGMREEKGRRDDWAHSCNSRHRASSHSSLFLYSSSFHCPIFPLSLSLSPLFSFIVCICSYSYTFGRSHSLHFITSLPVCSSPFPSFPLSLRTVHRTHTQIENTCSSSFFIVLSFSFIWSRASIPMKRIWTIIVGWLVSKHE